MEDGGQKWFRAQSYLTFQHWCCYADRVCLRKLDRFVPFIKETRYQITNDRRWKPSFPALATPFIPPPSISSYSFFKDQFIQFHRIWWCPDYGLGTQKIDAKNPVLNRTKTHTFLDANAHTCVQMQPACLLSASPCLWHFLQERERQECFPSHGCQATNILHSSSRWDAATALLLQNSRHSQFPGSAEEAGTRTVGTHSTHCCHLPHQRTPIWPEHLIWEYGALTLTPVLPRTTLQSYHSLFSLLP